MTQDTVKKGFSLVESLVAITILIIAVIAPMSIASTSIKTAVLAREQLTAVFLAQEGFELVLYRRDNNALSVYANGGVGDTWAWFDDAVLNPCKDPNGCGIDSALTVIACGNDGINCELNFNPGSSGMYYTYGTGAASGYKRVIRMTEIQTDKEAEVEVTVTWRSDFTGEDMATVVTNRIFNQYDLFEI